METTSEITVETCIRNNRMERLQNKKDFLVQAKNEMRQMLRELDRLGSAKHCVALGKAIKEFKIMINELHIEIEELSNEKAQ